MTSDSSSRTTLIALGSCCGIAILVTGITCAILGAKGYFGFKDPCIGVISFELKDVDFGASENGNSLMGFLDTVTGGLASEFIPTQVTLTLELLLEVNNTNPYDMDYEQTDEGNITIPLTDEGGGGELAIGTWEVPAGTLESKASNEIPVTFTTTIDLLGDDTLELGGKFATGGPLAFRVDGEITGNGWVPGVKGQTSFICLAEIDSILEVGQDATIKCKNSVKVPRVLLELNRVSEFNFSDFTADEVDPACLV